MPASSTKKGMPPPAAVVSKNSRAMEPMLPTTQTVSPRADAPKRKARTIPDAPTRRAMSEQGEGLATSTAPPTHGLPAPADVPRKKARAALPVDPNSALPEQGEDPAEVALPTSAGMPVLADVISSIRELHRERQDYHSAEKRMTLQIKSIQRRVHARTCPTPGRKKCACKDLYDAMPAAAMVLSEQESIIHKHRLRPEKELRKLAEQLPVWLWVESITGFGALGLAQIIAECGDLSKYAGPAKLWTRMGVGRYQRTDGTWERQRKAEGENGVLAQYSPTRRSIMYVIGDCIIKAGGAFRAVYDVRKLFEAEKPSCGRAISTGGQCEDPERPGHCRPGHIHNRAKRFMEKRLLRDLWREWRRAIPVVNPMGDAPVATTPEH